MAGTTKLRVAAALASAALRGDGVLTLAAGALAAVTLLALIGASALDGGPIPSPRLSSRSALPPRAFA